jgi:hypothetical protein
MELQLGSTVKDRITGFRGIVTGYVTYISGCNQCLVVPPVDKEGKKRDGEWIDEQRLEVQRAKIIRLDNHAGTGFDQEAPKR